MALLLYRYRKYRARLRPTTVLSASSDKKSIEPPPELPEDCLFSSTVAAACALRPLTDDVQVIVNVKVSEGTASSFGSVTL